MPHVPAPMNVTVEPETVQMPSEDGESSTKLTGSPDVAVAEMSYVDPSANALVGGVDVMETVWLRGAREKSTELDDAFAMMPNASSYLATIECEPGGKVSLFFLKTTSMNPSSVGSSDPCATFLRSLSMSRIVPCGKTPVDVVTRVVNVMGVFSATGLVWLDVSATDATIGSLDQEIRTVPSSPPLALNWPPPTLDEVSVASGVMYPLPPPPPPGVPNDEPLPPPP